MKQVKKTKKRGRWGKKIGILLVLINTIVIANIYRKGLPLGFSAKASIPFNLGLFLAYFGLGMLGFLFLLFNSKK